MSADADLYAGLHDLLRRHHLPPTYLDALHPCLLPLADYLAAKRRILQRALIWGICGAQGSGKSTLAQFLAFLLRQRHGLSCLCLSLDDCYLDRASRQRLAAEVHPLFVTRGVPGTHDSALGMALLRALRMGAERPEGAGGEGPRGSGHGRAGPGDTEHGTGAGQATREPPRLPVFDKSHDEPLPASAWPLLREWPDIVLFEGWCVGTPPEPEERLRQPVNTLEAEEDAKGLWRRHVNHHLQTDYRQWWSLLDGLLFLRVPGFAQVLQWRLLQETRLRDSYLARGAAVPAQVMSAAQIHRFIHHYERLTRWNLDCLPLSADLVLDLQEDHRFGGLRRLT